MMNAIMLSLYPGSDITPVIHKYMFDDGKYIHRKTRKTEVEGSRTDNFWIIEHIVLLSYYRFSCSLD